MQSATARRRDPALAAALSAAIPGAGLLYADELGAFGIVLGVEIALFALGWWVLFIPVHAVQIAVAAGTASICGERGHDVFAARRDEAMTSARESGATSP